MLNTTEHQERLQKGLRESGHFIIEVPLPESLNGPPEAELCFLQDDSVIRLLVSEDVSYEGDDPQRASYFEEARPVEMGWQEIRVILSQNPADILRHAEELLEISSAKPYSQQSDERGPYPNQEDHGQPSPLSSLTDMEAVSKHLLEEDKSQQKQIDKDALFESLAQNVRGQDAALLRIAQIVRRHFARVKPKRPSSLFAVGPTGVGKTFTAQRLCKALKEQDVAIAFERFDMNEFQEEHRVSTLLGAPPGYVGHEEGGQLVDALRVQGRSIILFDEIEKAHPKLLMALMNAMDAGRLSSGRGSSGSTGRTVDCRGAIFIFTSNLRSEAIMEDLKGLSLYSHGEVDELCRRHLRQADIKPELIGRITAFLIYQPLDATTQAEIATLSIVRVAREYGVHVAYVDPIVVARMLSEQRNSSGYGARPLMYCADRLCAETFITAAEEYGCGAKVAIKMRDSDFYAEEFSGV